MSIPESLHFPCQVFNHRISSHLFASPDNLVQRFFSFFFFFFWCTQVFKMFLPLLKTVKSYGGRDWEADGRKSTSGSRRRSIGTMMGVCKDEEMGRGGEKGKDGRVCKGWLGFTVQHNIRVVCVGTASGGTLRTCLPLRRHPPPPQDALTELLIGRHYSKWRLRHIRSVLLAYRERRRRPFS